MTIVKPDLEAFKNQGLEVLNLDNLKNMTAEDLELKNPDFLFEESYDYNASDEIYGFYIIHKYYVADEASWRRSCNIGNPSNGFTIDLDGENYDTLEKYIEYLNNLD